MAKLFVGGFPRDLEEIELQEIIEEYGKVSGIKIIRDKSTGVSRRFGFVEMASREDALRVIEMLHGGSIDGEEMSIKPATVTQTKRVRKRIQARRK